MFKFVVFFMIFATSAFAMDCNRFNDKDERNYCKALEQQRKSYCDSIIDKDMRYSCKARIDQSKQYCMSIHDKNERNRCMVNSDK